MAEGIIQPKIQVIKIEEGPNKGQSVSVKKDMGHLSIMSQDLPDIKEWQVGQEYKLVISVRQTESGKLDRWDIEQGRGMPEDIRARFDIIGIELPDTQPVQKSDPASTPDVQMI